MQKQRPQRKAGSIRVAQATNYQDLDALTSRNSARFRTRKRRTPPQMLWKSWPGPCLFGGEVSRWRHHDSNDADVDVVEDDDEHNDDADGGRQQESSFSPLNPIP